MRMPRLPRPVQVARAPWYVEISYETPDEARHWSPNEISALIEQYGEDTDELAEAMGPEPGFTPTRVVGPYTAAQAQRLSEWLHEPDVQQLLGVVGAAPMQLQRIDPELEVRLATLRGRQQTPA